MNQKHPQGTYLVSQCVVASPMKRRYNQIHVQEQAVRHYIPEGQTLVAKSDGLSFCKNYWVFHWLERDELVCVSLGVVAACLINTSLFPPPSPAWHP
jgi:hypothetical protein